MTRPSTRVLALFHPRRRGVREALTLGSLVGALGALSGCAGQPTLRPNAVQISGADLMGLAVRSDVSVYNPKAFSLTVQSVAGTIVLNNTVTMGSAEVPSGAYLPRRSWQRVVVDMRLPWLNVPAVLALAHSMPLVPYTFEGHARIGGGRIRLTVPFRSAGMVEAQELMRAGALQTPQGLPFPFGNLGQASAGPAWWMPREELSSHEPRDGVGGGIQWASSVASTLPST